MRVAVYAIAKNEAKHVDRWWDSMSEADGVFVLDTGSTDGTPELLRSKGAHVAVFVNEPFRFDVSRNASMALVPPTYDWLVCTDLDEVFTKGWRAALEKAVAEAESRGEKPNGAVCDFVISFSKDGRPLSQMDYWKAHKRGCVRWVSPIHEYLEWIGERRYVKMDCRLEHHPDDGKSRAQYLPMLEAAVLEDPNPRNLFYLGRELLFNGRPAGAVAALAQYLMHPQSTFKKERAWAYRYVARVLRESGEYAAAVRWYVAAAGEDGEQRESLVEYAKMCWEIGQRDEAIRAMQCAVSRKVRPKVFFTEDDCWDGTPEWLLEEWKRIQENGDELAKPDKLD